MGHCSQRSFRTVYGRLDFRDFEIWGSAVERFLFHPSYGTRLVDDGTLTRQPHDRTTVRMGKFGRGEGIPAAEERYCRVPGSAPGKPCSLVPLPCPLLPIRSEPMPSVPHAPMLPCPTLLMLLLCDSCHLRSTVYHLPSTANIIALLATHLTPLDLLISLDPPRPTLL